MDRVFALSLVVFFLIFINGCSESEFVDKPDKLYKDISWEYDKYPQFTFGVQESVSPIKLDLVDAVIVKRDATYYGIDNAMRIGAPCSATPDKIDFCMNAKKASDIFGNKEATLYVAINIEWNIDLSEEGEPIENLIAETNAKKIYKFDTSIPQTDEDGFVDDMDLVDDTWCWIWTDAWEYGANKPKCEEYISTLKTNY
ncbi:MAG: hypothetical protein ABIH25_01315 [Candidatus Woesearchaeota archaeon]